jgi:hypothetical protein
MKNCNKCKEVKPYEFFSKYKPCKDGYQTTCKKCMVQIVKKYNSQNKEKINEYQNQYQKEYRKENKEKNKEYNKKYQKENRKKINEYYKSYRKNRIQNDSLFRFSSYTRTLIKGSFKRNNKFKKNTKTENILGCTIEEFRNYIEIKFTKKMTFENYGEWHLDHIIPISSAQTEEEVIRLNHYTNFQPMWAKENISKGNKIIEKQLTLL